MVACAMFESPPNTAFTLSVPRKATSWKPYVVPGWSPKTVHVRSAPIALPASGVAHVPRVTLGSDPPHEIGATPKRTSQLAGSPVPSLTSVNARVAPVSVTPTTARFVTVPGLLTGAVTVLAAVPATPSLVAVIVAVPAATPVTRPLAETVATVLLLVVQVTVRPLRAVPLASFGVAVN